MTDLYRKDLTYPELDRNGDGRGYSVRPKGARIQSIVIHTTNGAVGSSFFAESEFLRDTPKVSAHRLVSKAGEIVTILPDELMAWHAGICVTGFANSISLGVEMHYTPGEQVTLAQLNACGRLVRGWMRKYQIPLSRVEAHRTIALPHGRKIDPSNMATDALFTAWKATLGVDHPETDIEHGISLFILDSDDGEANVRQGPGREFPIAAVLHNDDPPLEYDTLVGGEEINGNAGWWHLNDERGFVWSGLLKKVK